MNDMLFFKKLMLETGISLDIQDGGMEKEVDSYNMIDMKIVVNELRQCLL